MLRQFYRNNINQLFFRFKEKNRHIPYCNGLIDIGKNLYKYGIIRINNIANEEIFKSLKEIEKYVNNIDKTKLKSANQIKNIYSIVEESRKTNNSFYINRGSEYFYNRNKNSFSTIDNGLIDIIEPKYLSNHFWVLEDLLIKNIFPILLEDINCIYNANFSYSHSSLYLYKNVISPRCLHVDSANKGQLKLFISLSDILNINEGPYAYVPKSHRNSLLNKLNYIVNKIFLSDIGNNYNDASLTSSIWALPIFTEKYDMYISDNNGIHGDLPCNLKSIKKEVLVYNFVDL